MYYTSSLKPFVLNLDDLNFLLKHVTFRPLFDASGNALIAWDGTGPELFSTDMEIQFGTVQA